MDLKPRLRSSPLSQSCTISSASMTPRTFLKMVTVKTNSKTMTKIFAAGCRVVSHQKNDGGQLHVGIELQEQCGQITRLGDVVGEQIIGIVHVLYNKMSGIRYKCKMQ